MDKEKFIEQYKNLKDLNKGKKPLYRDFLKFCGIHKRKLDEVFGKNAYSKLQEECGDNPNFLILKRTQISQILDQYGELVRKNKTLPVAADWVQAKFKPSVDGISKIHKIKGSNISEIFCKEYAGKSEWKDVIEIIKGPNEAINRDKTNKAFKEIVDKILNWTPDRKRIIKKAIKLN